MDYDSFSQVKYLSNAFTRQNKLGAIMCIVHLALIYIFTCR